MQYEGIVIRPPSEADSLILQATFGCSHNKCTFCPTYKGTKFRIKDIDEKRAFVRYFWKATPVRSPSTPIEVAASE